MKKFILGFLCGVIFVVPCFTFASTQVAAYLFPSNVVIHNEGSEMVFDSGSSPFINYNDRIYVPLRAFSESMGYYVNFKNASSSNGNLLAGESCSINLPSWDFKDKNGNLVLPGKYAIQLNFPDNFEYYYSGSNDIEKMPIQQHISRNRCEFNLVKL